MDLFWWVLVLSLWEKKERCQLKFMKGEGRGWDHFTPRKVEPVSERQKVLSKTPPGVGGGGGTTQKEGTFMSKNQQKKSSGPDKTRNFKGKKKGGEGLKEFPNRIGLKGSRSGLLRVNSVGSKLKSDV